MNCNFILLLCLRWGKCNEIIFYCVIQEYLQLASDALFNATKRVSGRYFNDVTILVPRHWPANGTEVATTESHEKATFLVEHDGEESSGLPHTVRLLNDCGSPGKVTILPESFILNNNKHAASYGKFIVK